MFRNLSSAVLASYDNDIESSATTGRLGQESESSSNESVDGRLFTQDEVNSIMATERRKQQAALERSEMTYKELLKNNSSLSDHEREALEESLNAVQGQLQTREQQAALDRKRLENDFQTKLDESKKQAAHWESLYRNSTIERELQQAAVNNDAYRPEQITTLLRDNAKLVEVIGNDGKPTGQFKVDVEFSDVDPTTGESLTTTRTPADAVQRMKELPEIYGNLFKSNVVSGVGANSTSGTAPGGKMNLRELAKDPVAFRKVLKENPELIMNR